MQAFEPINFDFDQDKLYQELMQSNIFDNSFLATVIYSQGRSKYDKDGFFDEYSDVVHYDDNGKLVEAKYKTFQTYNFTHLPDVAETFTESFVDTPEGRRPVWHIYDTAWEWKETTPSYLKEVVNNLGLSYVSCVRLVGQTPPSKGIVHVDADFKDNLRYFKKGGVSITLNVSDGGGHLQYRVGNDLHTVDESQYKCWFFNDALQHCTTEITSPRIQIRVFGHK